MNTENLRDDDIRAFNAPAVAATPAPTPKPPQRARWPWVLGGAALMLVVVLGLLSWALVSGLLNVADHATASGLRDWQVVVNGQDWDGFGDFSVDGAFDLFGGLFGTFLGLLIAGVVLLLVLPLTLVFGLGLPLLLAGGGLVLALVLGVGALALGLSLVLGIVGAPFLLVLALAWWFVRDSKKRHGV